uniref:Transposase n=1 Tax=Ditylenchus dipsaci TaxID=166011 RepID=A0A915CXL8_9BILA
MTACVHLFSLLVEIDESKFDRRKYNRGHRVEGSWVFGGISRSTGECLLGQACAMPMQKRYAVINALQDEKSLAQEDAEIVVLEENVAKKDAQIVCSTTSTAKQSNSTATLTLKQQ